MGGDRGAAARLEGVGRILRTLLQLACCVENDRCSSLANQHHLLCIEAAIGAIFGARGSQAQPAAMVHDCSHTGRMRVASVRRFSSGINTARPLRANISAVPRCSTMSAASHAVAAQLAGALPVRG